MSLGLAPERGSRLTKNQLLAQFAHGGAVEPCPAPRA
jgi:hypothetical protein